MAKTTTTQTTAPATGNTRTIEIPLEKLCGGCVKFAFPKDQAPGDAALTNAYVMNSVPGIRSAKAVRITVEAIQ